MARCQRCNKFMLVKPASGFCKDCEILNAKEEEERRRNRPETVFQFIDNSSSDVFAKWLQADDFYRELSEPDFYREVSDPIVYMVLFMYTEDVEKEIINGVGISKEKLRTVDWKNYVRRSSRVRAKARTIPPLFIKVPIRDLF